MTTSCKSLEPLLTGFADRELDEKETAKVQAHLDECEGCRQALAAERTVRGTVRSVYHMDATPPALRARVREDLFESSKIPGFIESVAQLFSVHTLKAAATAAVLALLVLVPYLNRDTSTPAPHDAFEYVTVDGNVICLDCELASRAGHTPECAGYHHLGLESEKGELWRFIDSSAGKDLISNRSYIGQALKVQGQAKPAGAYHLIDVQSYQKI